MPSVPAAPPVVIAYHAVHGSQGGVHAPDVITSPEALERDVRDLLKRGYRFRTAGELVEETGGSRPPARTAVLTFDDGWLNGLTVAAPLLLSLGVRATFFVCPGLWGGHDPRMGDAGAILSAAQAGELGETGMELGAHSMTHPDLRTLGERELTAELADSKAAVEDITAQRCRAFAYPFGLHDRRVRRAARCAGFAVAFGYRPGPWHRLAAPRQPAA
jgi:peptidoglycan/xylan/chitin deacetylase (PgdA/CDA1 family)